MACGWRSGRLSRLWGPLAEALRGRASPLEPSWQHCLSLPMSALTLCTCTPSWCQRYLFAFSTLKSMSTLCVAQFCSAALATRFSHGSLTALACGRRLRCYQSMQVSTPDVREDILTAEDEVLIMASDGLWDVIANQEAINIIKDTPVCTAPPLPRPHWSPMLLSQQLPGATFQYSCRMVGLVNQLGDPTTKPLPEREYREGPPLSGGSQVLSMHVRHCHVRTSFARWGLQQRHGFCFRHSVRLK